MLRWRPRRAVEELVFTVVLPVIVVVAGAAIAGGGPVDYRFYYWIAATAAIIGGLLSIPVFVLRLFVGGRVAVALSAAGIDVGPAGGIIAWEQIAGIHAVWRPLGRHIVLTPHHGRPVTLYAPRGSAWLPDPRYRQDLAELRQWVSQHGDGIEIDRARRSRWAVTGAVCALVVLAAAAGRAGYRGVTWPWTPIAVTVSAACPALSAAGLNTVWSAAGRRLDRDEINRLEIGDYSYCGWSRQPGNTAGEGEVSYLRLTAVVKRHAGFSRYSAIAMAARSFRSEYSFARSPVPVSGLGDQAYRQSDPYDVEVTARLANVTTTITIALDPRRHSDTATAADIAQTLTAALLAGITVGTGTRPRAAADRHHSRPPSPAGAHVSQPSRRRRYHPRG
ncbi:hypothetical protein ACQPZJ_44745 [Actinoplanes sp. CA-054009]